LKTRSDTNHTNGKHFDSGPSSIEYILFIIHALWIRWTNLWPQIHKLSLWLEVHALAFAREEGQEYAGMTLPVPGDGDAVEYRIQDMDETLRGNRFLVDFLRKLGIEELLLDVRLESNQISDMLVLLHAWRHRFKKKTSGGRLKGGMKHLFSGSGLQMSCALIRIENHSLQVTYSYCMTKLSRTVKWFERRHPRFKDHRAMFLAAPRYALIVAGVTLIPFVIYSLYGNWWLLLVVTVLGALLLFFLVYVMLMTIGSVEYDNEEKAYRLEVTYERLKRYSDGVREDLGRARAIQENLLPDCSKIPFREHLEWACSVVPQAEVGGDYFDIAHLGEKRIGILFADVSGHGMSAALVTAIMKVAFEGWQDRGLPLKTFTEYLNRLLFRVTPAKSFAAAILGSYDADSRMLSYINCGHSPAPIMIPGDLKRDITSLDHSSAMILGVLEKHACIEKQLALESGDTVLFTTDGLIEAMDRENRMFGMERLLDFAASSRGNAPQDLVTGLIHRIREFMDGVPQNDDQMIMAFRVRP